MRQGLTSLGLYETGKEKVLCLMAYHLQETFCILSVIGTAERESKRKLRTI